MASNEKNTKGFNLAGNNKKYGFNTVPNDSVSWHLQTADGTSFGNVSYGAYKAIKDNTLDSYTPKNDNEKKAISDFTAYAKEQYDKQQEAEKQKRINSNPTFARYNIDPADFDFDDLTKWAGEHNQTMRVNSSTMSTYYTPKYEGGFLGIGGKKLSTDEEDADLEVLYQTAANNERAELAQKDLGAFASAMVGFADGATLGAVTPLADWSAKKQYEDAGLDSKTFISPSQAHAKTVNEHVISGAIGDIAGSLLSMGAVGKAVSAATKGIKLLSTGSKVANIVKPMLDSGLTFAIVGGAEEAISGGDYKDVIKEMGIDFVSGVAGSAAGQLTAKGLSSALTGKLSQKFISKITTDTDAQDALLSLLKNSRGVNIAISGLSGAAFSTAKTGTSVALRNDEQITGKQLAVDAAVAFLASSISYWYETENVSAKNKKYVMSETEKIIKEYDQFRKDVVNISKEQADVEIGQMRNRLSNLYTFFKNNQFVGSGKEVANVLYNTGRLLKGPFAIEVSNAGTGEPTATNVPISLGSGTTPGVTTGATPKTSVPPVSSASANVPTTKKIDTPVNVAKVPQSVPNVVSSPVVDGTTPIVKNTNDFTDELSEVASAGAVAKMAPENSSGEIKKLDKRLIADGADDASRKEIIEAALEIEKALAGSGKTIRSVFDNVSKITNNAITEIKNKAGATNAYWNLFKENFKAVKSGNITENTELVTEYASAYSKALKNSYPEIYNSAFLATDGSDLSSELPHAIMRNVIPENVQNADKFRSAATQIKNIVSVAGTQISSERAEIYGAKADSAVPTAENTGVVSEGKSDSQINAQTYNIVVSELKRKAEELGLSDAKFYTTLQNVYLYNPTENDRALISSEFHRIYANNTDPLVKNLLDFIDSANTQTLTNTNQPNTSDTNATDAVSMYDQLEKYRLTYDEQSAILNYKSSDSYKINEALRNGDILDSTQKSFVNTLNSALDKFPVYRGTVYRNIGFDNREDFDSFIQKHQNEKSLKYNAFTSASKSVDGYIVDMPYTANYEIFSHDGKDISEIGIFDENEVLFKSGTEFSIRLFEVRDNEIKIRCEELKNDGTKLQSFAGETGNKETGNGNAEQNSLVRTRSNNNQGLDSVRERSASNDRLLAEEPSGERERFGGNSSSDSVELRTSDRDDTRTQGVLQRQDVTGTSVGGPNANFAEGEILSLKHTKNVYSLFKGAGRVIVGKDVISDGFVAMPLTDEALAGVKKVAGDVIQENPNLSLSQFYHKGNDVVIQGNPKADEITARKKTEKAYVFKIGDAFYTCQQKYIDAFNNGKNVITANKNVYIPWNVHNENGELVALFLGTAHSMNSERFNSLQSVSDIISADRLKKAESANRPFNQNEIRQLIGGGIPYFLAINGSNYIGDGHIFARCNDADAEFIKNEYRKANADSNFEIETKKEFGQKVEKLLTEAKDLAEAINPISYSGANTLNRTANVYIVGDYAILFNKKYADLIKKRSKSMKIISNGSLSSTLLIGYDADGNITGFALPLYIEGEVTTKDGKTVPFVKRTDINRLVKEAQAKDAEKIEKLSEDKKRNLATAENANALSSTPETTNSTASTDTVSQDKAIVNSSIRNDVENNASKLTDKCELIATKHTATGNDIWVVTLKDRLSSEEYKDLSSKVKAVGGYYSKFAKTPDGKAIPGFVFKTEPTAKEIKVFNDFFGYTDETASDEKSTTPTENQTANTASIESKPDLKIGDVIEYNGKRWKVSQTGFNMVFENLDKSDRETTFSHIGGMDSFNDTHDYKVIKESAKNVESQSEILAKEGKPNGGRLHTGASETDVERGIERPDGPNRNPGGKTLSGSVGTDGSRSNVGDDSERIYRTDDAEISVSKVRGTSAEIVENEPQTIDTEVKTIEKKRPSNNGNFVITNDIAAEFDNTPPSAKDNIEAIELLLTLENEGRAATAEEKKILAKYKGWGGINLRNLPYDLSRRIDKLFDYEQRKAMQSSQNNAFYTPTKVIDAMYNGLKRMGFKGGNVLETSMGIGNFFGRMPIAISAKSALTGVELEPYTARIAQYLYPGATVINMPFQDVAIKNGSYDLVIGNVPFGQNKISYNRKKYSLHNYFIVSSLDKVRDGGIVAVITSAGTLESHSIDARKAIMDRADVVACYKLPEKVFSRNASTDVQSDLLILRKRASDAKPSGDSILNTTTTADGLIINEYFIKHPENILGTLAKGTNAWGDITTVHNSGDFYDKLDAAMKKLPKDLISGKIDLKPIESIVSLSDKPRFFEKNGKIYADDGAGTATEVSRNQVDTVRDYIAVRDAYKELLEAYDRDLSDEEIKPLRDFLSNAYDLFYKKHGAITGDGKKKIGDKRSANNTFLEADADYYLVSGLERYDPKNNEFVKSALFEKDTLRKKRITSVDAASDALAVSLNESGKIDFARMQELTGKTEKQLAEELKGEIVLTPEGDYVLTDIYLSGNIYEKLDAVKGKPGFKEQQEMLEKVIPAPKGASDITVKLGANYIDVKYVEQFAKDVLNSYLTIRKDISGRWLIDGVNQSRYGDVVNVKYGCDAFNAVQLLEKILNDGEITATKKVGSGDNAVTVLDYEMTDIARQKADDIRSAFESWIFSDSERRTEIVNKYNRTYNNYRPLDYGRIAGKLSFDSMDETLKAKLYPHQKKGIARFLFGGNILFAHGVGTGKTFEMIASVMEAKRMGIINKAAMVVPNNKVVDFKKDIAQAYPNAKVLVIDTANKKRQTMLGLVNSNDWDIVLIARTTFTKIPVSRELQAHFAASQLEDLELQIAEAENDRNVSNRQRKSLITRRDNLEQKLKDLNTDTNRDENSVDFEKLGIDCICVDEAHNYKSIMTPTKLDIKGLVNKNNAQMANDMLMKLDYIRSIDGKIIFGTGTPITNTVSEIYNMMRMVRPDILEEAGIHSLDEWVNTFAKIETTTEIGIDNQIKTKSTQVIRSFVNVSEMIGMFRQFSDIVFTEDVVKNLPKAVYKDIEIAGTDKHKQIEEHISKVLATTPKADQLKVYGQLMAMADAASVDLRMLSGAESECNIFKDYSLDELEYENSKINVMCNYVYEEYTASNDIKGTQIIFCDKGSGSGTVYSFNLHNDIMQKLIDRGIPKDQIVIVKNQTDSQLEALYEKVNAGEVRVLIGTSQKMAEGLNVQKRVVAIHHPTVTYKPSDKEQGDARGVRAGNINDEVHIYRYLQKNTFDSHKWQAQDRKGEMINKALRGELVTEMEDIGADEDSGAGVDAATAMAITSGNPLVKEKIDIDKEVARLKTLQRNYFSEVYRYQDAIAKNPGMISQLTTYADNIRKDIALRDKYSEKPSINIVGKAFEKQTEANKALLEAVKKAPKNGKYTKLGTYDGFDIMFKGDTGGMNYTLVLKGANEYAVEYAGGNGNNIARMSGVLDRLDAVLARTDGRLETLKSDLDFAKKEVAKPFEKEQDLSDALAKQKDVTYRYEHYNDISADKTSGESSTHSNDTQKSTRNSLEENAKYSFTESEGLNDEQTGSNILSGNGGRTNNASAGKQAERISDFKQKIKGKTKAERQSYAKELLAKELTSEQIDGTHKYNLVKPEAYNEDMQSIVAEAKKDGKEVGFFVGPALRKFDGQRDFLIDGIKVSDTKILLRYDGYYSPQTLLKHEDVHILWSSPEMQKAKDIILNGLSDAEKERLLSDGRYKDYMDLYKNDTEAVWEEFVADVFAGMNDYTADYIDVVADYWHDRKVIDRYSPAEYNNIIDAGGTNASVLDNVGFGSDNLITESGETNGSKNSEALAGNGAGESYDSIWKRSNDSKAVYKRVGSVSRNKPSSLGTKRGFIDWCRGIQPDGLSLSREKERCYGIFREISKRGISTVDSEGRELSAKTREYFANTVFKNKKGELIPLFHATDNDFHTFEFGDFGFHVGSAEQAIKLNREYIKELYVNITNPFYIPVDRGIWPAFVVAYEANEQGVITQNEYDLISKMEGFHDKSYKSKANVYLRKLLKSRGYDGIIYNNGYEGEGISAIAFDSNQLKYVSNNNPSKSPDTRYALNTYDKDAEELTPERKKQIFEQFEKDRAEVDKPTLKQLWGERAAWVAHNVTRVFPNIPERGERGTFFAEFRKSMIQWKNLPSTASFMVQDKLNKMTEGLTPKEFKTFSELVYFLDLQEEAQIQKDKGYIEILLPNKITPDEVDSIVKVLNEEATENVRQALIKRQNIWEDLKTQYIDLNRYIGFDTDGKFKRKNYYHHQVIEYMNSGGKGTGSREIGIKAGRGWLKERQGSTKAINTDFLAVEYKAMLQMQYDVYIAETLGRIKKQYDIKPQLEDEAFRNNKNFLNEIIRKEATDKNGNVLLDSKGKPDSETYRRQMWYNSRIMFGFDGLFDLADRNELPTYDGEYAKVVEALKRHDLNVSGLYKYVGTVASTDLPDNATDAQEQAVMNARTVMKYTSQKKAWIKSVLADNYQTWETIAKSMSDTYTIHQPRRGNYFYTKEVIDEDAFNKAYNDMVLALASGDIDLGNTDINNLFAQYSDTVRLTGAAFEQWVLPNEIVATMNEIANPKQASDGAKIARSIVSAWKGWATSVNPLRTVKFGSRNLSGDLDAVIAGNPKIVMYSNKAVQDIYQAMRHKKYSPEYMEWIERGGYTSMIFANEMDSEMQDKLFSHLKEKQGVNIFKIPIRMFEKYYDGVENVHNFREAILRYSAYLYFKEAIKRNGGTVKDYVASNKYIVRGLNTVEDKAYQLSKDLLGSYDEVGKLGQTLRRYWIPFYSFTETNLKRYYRLFENIITSDDKIPKKAGKLLLKALMVNMLGLLIAAWNKLVMKDADDKLPPSARNIPHLTLGMIGDRVYSFRQLGSFSELLEWFGLDDYKWTAEDLTAPLDKAWGMVTPFLKMPIELVSGLNFYPSLTHPRAIRDKWQHFFSSLGVDEIYDAVTGKPTRGVGEILKSAFIYSYDYKESAYYEILDIKREYQGKTDNTIYGIDAKSNALYYMKMAVRYKDKEAALKYLDEYFENGGTVKGIKQSFATLNPMYGFTSKDTMEKGEAFIASLTEDQKEKLKIAQDYYENDLMLPENVLALLGKKDITDEEAKNVMKGYINAKCK